MAWLSKPVIGVSFPEILAQKQHDFINYVNSLSHVGSRIEIARIEPNLLSVLKATPQALVNAFFRPTIFEVSNAMMLLAAMENLLIVLTIFLAFFFFSKQNLQKPWLWFSISFTIILFTLGGLTTPVLGALVRYKAPALPFLGITFMYLLDFDKIKKLRKQLIQF